MKSSDRPVAMRLRVSCELAVLGAALTGVALVLSASVDAVTNRQLRAAGRAVSQAAPQAVRRIPASASGLEMLAWAPRHRGTTEDAPARGHLTPVIEAASKRPSRHRPGAGTVAMLRCYEIALLGLRMQAELPAVRARLMADFPQILSVAAIPSSATVLILYVGDPEPDAWLDTLSDAVLNLRRRLRPSPIRPSVAPSRTPAKYLSTIRRDRRLSASAGARSVMDARSFVA